MNDRIPAVGGMPTEVRGPTRRVTLGRMAGTTVRVRRQPCLNCGEKVVIVESRRSALGGLLGGEPTVTIQHADFEPGPGRTDAVDSRCRRAPVRPS